MKILLLMTVCFFTFLETLGQSAVNVVGTIPGQAADIKSGSGMLLTQLPLRKTEPEGDVYLYSDWTVTDLLLANDNGMIKEIPVKLNLQTNEIEINHKNEIKVLPGNRVEEFSCHLPNGQIEKYINAKAFKYDSIQQRGFLQELTKQNEKDQWVLFNKKELTFMTSNYNAALDMGHKNDRFIKNEVLLLGKKNILYKTKLPKKKFYQQFPGHEEKIRRFIKENRINMKSIDDLKKIVNYLNENQI